MMLRQFASLVLGCSVTALMAQTPALTPGEYISAGGWGHLAITTKGKALSFSLTAIGANVHTCDLAGEIHAGKATLEAMEPDKPCVVSFAAKAGGIDVSSGDSGTCRYYCGARASFEALYLAPAAGCTRVALRDQRSAFKKLYDQKSFAAARKTLEPVLEQCKATLHRLEEGRIRNDLAVTLHKLGELAECQRVLEPLMEDARLSDDELRNNYPPSDADMLLPIVRATRTNLRLCKAKA